METQKIPLWKQLLGALGGGAIALVLYGVYDVASPHVASLISMVTPTQAEEHVEVIVKAEGERWDDVIDLTQSILREKTAQ